LLPLIAAVVLVLAFSALALIVEAAAVLLAAYLWRGRWIVEASTDGPPAETKRSIVRGWAASRRHVREVSGAL
jgi:hypothetical protein